MGVTAKLLGLAKFKANALLATNRYRRAVGGAVYREASRVMASSIREVPVDTGRLRATGFVSAPDTTTRDVSVQLGYGTDYALPVHERTEVSHAVGKAKFLDDPLNAARSGMADRIARDTRILFEQNRGFATGPFPQRPPDLDREGD